MSMWIVVGWAASLVAVAVVAFVTGVLRTWRVATGSRSVGAALDALDKQ